MSAPLFSRRLLLSRAGAGLPVFGTFLLPGLALAADKHAGHPHKAAHPAGHEAAKAEPAKHKPLVMLDPGHGGKDPGAIGVSGTYEKRVALAAAHDLRHLLESDGRYRVVMTRTTDRFVELEERVTRAQQHGAALFVSMHADALHDHSVRGASVYTLAATASDQQTAQLAQRENSADRYARKAFQEYSPEVARILATLVQRETRVNSTRLATELVNTLGTSVPMLPNPERHAGFVVLKAADIPSVLVEMGFMSNRKDEAALRGTPHRLLVAKAMRRAVDAYFESRHMAAAIGAQDAG